MPVRPRLQVLEQMAVVIEGEAIIAVLPRADAATAYADATFVELPEQVLLPGFINMHTHSAMSLLRGFADDLKLQDWLNKHIWPAEQAFLSAEFVFDGVSLAMAEMLRGGTTCFNDLYFFPDQTARAAIGAGMRACIGLPVIEFPTVWAGSADECLDKGLETSIGWKDEPLITSVFAPHAPYTVGDPALDRIARLSDSTGSRVHMHVLESEWEIGESLREYGKATLDRLDDFGLLNERFLAVHMTQLTESDMTLLAEKKVNVIHCPESNLKLGNGICLVARLLDKNINVALGTDGAACNNDLDLLAESRTAALLAKGASNDPCVLSAFQSLEMMTINAATALGQASALGSIEAGKLADLCAIRMDSLNTTPMYDVVSQLIYAASSHQVSDVWVGGRRLLQEGKFLSMDVDDIMGRARHWATRIAAETRFVGAGLHDRHQG